MNNRIRTQKRGPKSRFAKRARLELVIESDIKERAPVESKRLGFPSLSHFIQHCLALLASGAAYSIPELHAPVEAIPAPSSQDSVNPSDVDDL